MCILKSNLFSCIYSYLCLRQTLNARASCPLRFEYSCILRLLAVSWLAESLWRERRVCKDVSAWTPNWIDLLNCKVCVGSSRVSSDVVVRSPVLRRPGAFLASVAAGRLASGWRRRMCTYNKGCSKRVFNQLMVNSALSARSEFGSLFAVKFWDAHCCLFEYLRTREYAAHGSGASWDSQDQ